MYINLDTWCIWILCEASREQQCALRCIESVSFISDRRFTRWYRLRYSPSESKPRSRGPATMVPGPRTACSQSDVSWELACRVSCIASYQRIEHPSKITQVWDNVPLDLVRTELTDHSSCYPCRVLSQVTGQVSKVSVPVSFGFYVFSSR